MSIKELKGKPQAFQSRVKGIHLASMYRTPMDILEDLGPFKDSL